MYREALKGRNVNLGTFNTFEYNATFLNSQPCFLTVTIYRAPKVSVPSFLTDLSELLSVIHMSYDSCILTGDFNIHMDNPTDTRTVVS